MSSLPLSAVHEQMLRIESAISPEAIAARECRTVTNPNELIALGFAPDQCRVPGLLFPVWGVDGAIVGYQYRPDHPRKDKRGKDVRYESLPAPAISRVDIPRFTHPVIRNPSVPLFATEGMKKADSAVSHGIYCIDLPGVWNWKGRNSYGGKTELADWEAIALNGREIIIAFDSDCMVKDSVRGAIEAFAGILERKGALVRYCLLPPGPNGAKTGLDDHFARGGTVEQLNSYIVDALPPQEPEWETPLSLDEPVLPEFPPETFTKDAEAFTDELTEAHQTPRDLPATNVLGALGATAHSYAVEVDPGYIEPTNLYLLTCLPSANRKSSVFSQVMAPIVAYERKQSVSNRDEIARWKAQRRIDELGQGRLEKEAAGNDQKAKDVEVKALENAQRMASESEPRPFRIIYDDITPEKIGSALAEQRGCISIMSPEGGSIFGNAAGRYSSGIPNFEMLLKGHAGDDIRVDRQGRESEFVPHARINLFLSPQPHVATYLGGIPGFRERGGAARMLASFPKSLLGYRKIRTKPVSEPTRTAWNKLISAILALSPPRDKDADSNLLPCRLLLTSDARAMLLGFQQEVEEQLRPGGALADMTDWGGKCPGAAARIAGLLHIADTALTGAPEAQKISVQVMARAIAVMRYYTAHAHVFYDHLNKTSDLYLAREVWTAIQAFHSLEITRQKLYQKLRDRAAFRKVDALAEPLRTLEDYGYIQIKSVSASGKQGGRPSTRILVNPLAIAPQNTQNPPTRELIEPEYDKEEAA